MNQIVIDNTTELAKTEEGYIIPAKTKRVIIRPAVLNYTLSNPLIHMYLEGFDDTGITLYQNDLTEMSFTNLPLSIVNDILDFSKIESGKMNIVEQEYEVKPLLSALASMLRVKAQEKNLAVDICFDETIPKKLYGDGGRIQQVVLNLLSNAVKYTEQGTITFSVKPEHISEGKAVLTFLVRDTGIGIRKEDMDKLFDSFERLDEKRNANIQGTGLGLSITKELLSLMDSRLMVESEYQIGSSFYFSLVQPVIDAEGIGPWEASYGEETQLSAYAPLFTAPAAHILVIDDYPMNLEVVKGLLRSTKVQIDTGRSGLECLSLVQKNHYDIILTANAIVGVKEKYLEMGFTDYLAKPVTSADLEHMLMTYLPAEKLEKTDVANSFLSPEPIGYGTQYTASISSATEHITSGTADAPLICTEHGLLYSGGKQDFYLSIIQMYEEDAMEKIPLMEAAYQNADWKNYTVYIHALKSTSKGIGADRLSKEAAKLEAAAKETDTAYIYDHHAEVMELYQAVLTEIRRDFLN